ncbi:MAG: hypothetical protein MZV63_60170 [Marinilabiliales bacterium]|nr:hypothetical protein [Marinilabiliales bacterium]
MSDMEVPAGRRAHGEALQDLLPDDDEEGRRGTPEGERHPAHPVRLDREPRRRAALRRGRVHRHPDVRDGRAEDRLHRGRAALVRVAPLRPPRADGHRPHPRRPDLRDGALDRLGVLERGVPQADPDEQPRAGVHHPVGHPGVGQEVPGARRDHLPGRDEDHGRRAEGQGPRRPLRDAVPPRRRGGELHLPGAVPGVRADGELRRHQDVGLPARGAHRQGRRHLQLPHPRPEPRRRRRGGVRPVSRGRAGQALARQGREGLRGHRELPATTW